MDFAEKSLLFHVYNHEGDDNEALENGLVTIKNHLTWSDEFLNKIILKSKQKENIYIEDNIIKLTDDGRNYAADSYKEIVVGLENMD